MIFEVWAWQYLTLLICKNKHWPTVFLQW